ncbi:MAG: GAF domain-containing SpoIIE family protein phosphatase [Chloroflexota bacterium]|nr:GAF domain-containing SpoIIE family protein phosphatase [Chloroflexota bacterium]
MTQAQNVTPAQNLTGIGVEHLTTLFDITRTINSSLDFDHVLNTVIDSMMQVTRAQRGFLMIAEPATGELRVRVARGIDGSDLASDESYSRTVVNQVVQVRTALLTNNAQFDFQSGQSIIMRGLRAILCAPMLVQERLIGVVYVDTSLRSGVFTDSDLQLLDAVAGQAGVAIENARLYLVAVEKGRLESELQMARQIQESLLPRRLPELAGYELAARWRSAREVAGDFYDVFMLEDGSMGLVIADVSDKGAPAALMMASTRSIIRSHAFSGFSPLDTLKRTNLQVLQDAENGMFVTVFYSVFYIGGTSSHICAGHNPPMLYRRADHTVTMLPRGGMAVGWFADNNMHLLSLSLQPGDLIIYYTDGLTESENLSHEFFGEGQLAEVILSMADKPAGEIADRILAHVDAFCGEAPPADDLTLCVVRYTGA